MKIVSPEKMKNDIQSSKDVKITPAGSKGLVKLKLAICKGLRKTVENLSSLNDPEIAPITAIGFGVVGFATLDTMSGGHPNVGIFATGIIASALPLAGKLAGKAEKNLRNLEASLLKRSRSDVPQPYILKAKANAGAR